MSSALQGRRVLVTRPKHQADELAQRIRELGAEPIVVPVISIGPPRDWGPLDGAIRELHGYDWVVFTSANGVGAFVDRMAEIGVREDALTRCKLAAIGPATARALAAKAREPDAVPQVFLSDAIADALGEVRDLRILLPRADIARRDLVLDLSSRGAIVDSVDSYSVVGESDPATIRTIAARLGDDCPEYVTLTSPSAFRGLRALLQAAGVEDWMTRSEIVCIGPVTAREVADSGFTPAAVATEHTVDGLVGALKERAEAHEQDISGA
jgi:uroporphyrinogen III methyltransferase/synthase